ncbi:MAG: hypothetical protein IKK33_13425 [Lachnospiraceae bacterium]|nr:hypothetical protein [Lachnospiraceae bacterium]
MNPMAILSMKSALEKFQDNHPKFMQFITAIAENGLEEGTVLECKVITPEGKEIHANIKINQDDLELIDKIKALKDN